MKITDSSASALKLTAGKSDQIWFDSDGSGFGVRLKSGGVRRKSGGSRKFVFQYRYGGKSWRETLGTVGAMSVKEARAKANKFRVMLDNGINPAAERESERAAATLTFSALRTEYLAARKGDCKPSSHAHITDMLTRLWKPLDGLPVGQITRATVADKLRTIATKSGAVGANRARSALSAFFAWCIGEGYCDDNPVTGTNKSAEKSRERTLTDAELGAIWNAAPEGDYGDIVRLLILTGQRRDEIGGLQWSEIGPDAIKLPGARTKNGRAHDVPLSTPAKAVLDARQRLAGREFVFGRGEGSYSGWSRSKARLDAELPGVEDWRLHDLRRTAATRMADLGVAPHVIEAVLNHVSGHKAGVAGVYNRSLYPAERKAALDLWAGHVLACAAKARGENVVSIAGARA